MTDQTETPTHEQASGLAEELRISIARLSRRMRNHSTSTLSVTQFATLAALDRHGSMTPRELSDHEKVQPPSMTRVVTYLEELGLLERAPHPTDGRQVILTVTDDGRETLRETRQLKRMWLEEQLRTLTDGEREILERAGPILEKLSRS